MPYTYIERAYGVKFVPGQRVRFMEYKGPRANGVVKAVRGDPHYVQVLFDDGSAGPCHPGSLEIIADKSVT